MKKVTLKDIKGSWSDIITRLEQDNSKIAHFLDDVQVHSFDGEQIVIDLINGHRFHLKTLEKDAKLVEEKMYDVLGRKIKIKFRLQEDSTKEWFSGGRNEPVFSGAQYDDDDILVTDEWYEYYRECAKDLKEILAIFDGPLFKNNYEKVSKRMYGDMFRTKFWDDIIQIRDLADRKDPEEMKEWLLHCRTIRRDAEIKKPKKVEYDIGRYKRECIDKLKHIEVSRSLLVEDRTYQTVDWWIKEMENNMAEFQDKKFLIEGLGNNTHRIRREQ